MLQEIEVTWRQFVIFTQVAQQWVNQHPEKSKFGYALQRVCTQYTKLDVEHKEAIEEVDYEFCYTEKRGEKEVITRDARGELEFDKTADSQKRAKYKQINGVDKIKVRPLYGAYKVPDDLSDAHLEAFAGFVISHEQVERIRAEQLAWINSPDEDEKSETKAPNGESKLLTSQENSDHVNDTENAS